MARNSSFSDIEHVEIKFIRDLGYPEDQDSPVWEVEIEGNRYALKMVGIFSNFEAPVNQGIFS